MQSLLDATQPKGRHYYWKSHYLPGIDAKIVDVLREHATRHASPHSAILLFQIGGALGEQAASHSPVGNRDAAFVLNITASWENAADDAANKRWARDCFDATRAFSTGGTYVNFLNDDDGADRIEAAYGRTNLERLERIKRQLDPENLFRHAKSIKG